MGRRFPKDDGREDGDALERGPEDAFLSLVRGALEHISIPVRRRPSRRPFFRWKEDGGWRAVDMPPEWAFESRAEYATCLLHEALHAAGYVLGTTRTGRDFADSSRSEERVAEWGSLIMATWCGLDVQPAPWVATLGQMTDDEMDEFLGRLEALGLQNVYSRADG